MKRRSGVTIFAMKPPCESCNLFNKPAICHSNIASGTREDATSREMKTRNGRKPVSVPLPFTVYTDRDSKVNHRVAITFFTSIVEFFVATSTQVWRVAEQLRSVYQTLGTVYAMLIPVPMARFAEPRRTVKDSPHDGGFELRISSVTDRVGALPVRVFGEADVISKRLVDRKGEIARIGVEYGDPHFSPYLGDLVAETYGVPFSDAGLNIVYT